MPFAYSPSLFYNFFIFFFYRSEEEILQFDPDMVYINRGSRSYVNQNEIDKMETIYTERVPKTPQGPAKYKVKYNDADPLLPVADNWRWGRAQPCKRSGFCKGGRRTLQVCRGSLLCTNANCPSLKSKIECVHSHAIKDKIKNYVTDKVKKL